MSRCFPFPPPGYEKKARPDEDANFLKKEKHKEKKHKKDKKDKEKKEKREKKDKESNGEKSREKKDRKRKHKERDKHKEKKKKDSKETKVIGSSSRQNGEKFAPTGIPVDQSQNGSLLLGLEKRVENQNGAREIRSVNNDSANEHSVRSSGKELESGLVLVAEGDQKVKDSTQEVRVPNGQSLKFSTKHLQNGFLGHIRAKEQKVVGEALCQEEHSKKRKERKDKKKDKSSDGRGDKHKDGDRERKSKSKDKKKKKEEKVKEVSTLPIENGSSNVDIQKDRGSYLFKDRNSNNGNLGKRKEPEMNGFVHGNGSPINKLPRPLPSSKPGQNGGKNDASSPGIQFVMAKEAAVLKPKLDAKASCSGSAFENGTKFNNRQTVNSFAPERQEAINNHLDKASESLSSLQPSPGIGTKLEHRQPAMNVASKEGMVTNHKLNKKILSSQSVAENGRKLESSKPSNFLSAETPRAVSKPKLDDQDLRINGLVLKNPGACSTKLSPVAELLKETVEKPPHPDAKYLPSILSVPEVQWSDYDDQEWLFSKDCHSGMKPKVSAASKESKHVWAEALQLESADVTALPYVIPY